MTWDEEREGMSAAMFDKQEADADSRDATRPENCENCLCDDFDYVGTDVYGADADGNRGRRQHIWSCCGCGREAFVWAE